MNCKFRQGDTVIYKDNGEECKVLSADINNNNILYKVEGKDFSTFCSEDNLEFKPFTEFQITNRNEFLKCYGDKILNTLETETEIQDILYNSAYTWRASDNTFKHCRSLTQEEIKHNLEILDLEQESRIVKECLQSNNTKLHFYGLEIGGYRDKWIAVYDRFIDLLSKCKNKISLEEFIDELPEEGDRQLMSLFFNPNFSLSIFNRYNSSN